MARNTIKISQVINDFLITLDHDDYANDVTHASVRVIALRGVREMGFDMLKKIRSIKLPVNASNSTVDLPDDFVDLVKIGSVSSDGLVYVMGENKNINYSQKYLEQNGVLIDSDGDGIYDRVDSKSSTSDSVPSTSNISDGLDDYIFRNYVYDNSYGRLYGVGGGNYLGQFRINLDQNRIEVDTHNGASEVVIEYIADEARSLDPSIHIYAEEALRAYIYYKLIERKASVPYNEKARARQEYYNEYRKANARMKSFSKEEALKTIRKNYKQSPKG